MAEKQIKAIDENSTPKEVYEAFENTTRKNIRAMIEHGNTSRRMAQAAKDDVQSMKEEIISLRQQLNQMNQRLAIVQGKLAQGGTT